jgi:outer membrane protein assembly factor BamD (BamD/ComL family)
MMRFMKESGASRVFEIGLALVLGFWLCPAPATAQDSGEQGTLSRGDRAEIAVTVRNSSGEVIVAPANVKLYKNGVPNDQSLTSRGRAFFIARTLGDFTIIVEATGYKTAQKDVSLTVPIKAEVDVYLQPETTSNLSVGVPGKPLLAPKAKEALVKGLQALGADKLDEAQKYLSEAMKLAPGNPEVLYVQGMVYMRRREWAQAQAVLEKSNQIEPNQPRVLAALGMALSNQKKYEEAIPLLEKSLELEPTQGWETEWALGKSYYYHGQYEQALKMARQAHAAPNASAPQVDLLLAQCLTAVGSYEESAQVLREFLKNNPGSPEATTARHWLDGLIANGKIHSEAKPSP